MESEDERKHQSIQRCDDLLREQNFPGTAIRKAAKRLAVMRAELDQLAVREKDAKIMVPWDGKEIRKRCRNLRKEYLTPISRAAKAIDGFMRDAPGAKEALKVPHLTDRAAVHVEAGERFTEFLRKHRTGFLRETGFDRNILSKLRAATDELRRQTACATTSRRERSSLLRDIKARLRSGRSQIGLLSNILEPQLIERKLVGAWAWASRVGVKLGRPHDTPEERAAKRVEAAKRQKEKVEEQRKRRELAKAARRAKRAAQEAHRKQQLAQRKELRRQRLAAPPLKEQPPVTPSVASPAEPPLSKAVFLERLAEESGEVER
ncbi:MAG: hypothetical protein ACHQQR_11210 [Gemmatimonadales bacterium]